MELFDPNKKWYKGNLHTHTTLSDGHKSPGEAMDIYREAGYDFISVTDHRIFLEGHGDNSFLALSGTEFHVNDFETRRAFHITGIGIEKEIYTDDLFTPQQIIDLINEHDGLAVIAHPTWSLLTHDDVMGLRGYAGVEVWNTVSEAYSGRGDSSAFIDVLASKGIAPVMLAVDDTHFYGRDLFGGYIMANSSGLGRHEIMDSIRCGRFYCSQGPEIKQIRVEEGLVTVETSPVDRVVFFSDAFFSKGRVLTGNGSPVTHAEYRITPFDSVLRIECADRDGKKAWSQFIKLEV